MPPTLPGITSDPCRLGGVKMPSFRNPAIRARHASRSSGVAPHASSAETCWRETAGSDTGNGCVGDAASPGTSLFGTGRSSTGNTGTPVSRLST